MQKIRFFISFFFILNFSFFSSAQNNKPVSPGTVNVVDMSDEQINRIVSEIKARGLTTNEAIVVAKSRGASQQQIDQILSRINNAPPQNLNKTSSQNYIAKDGKTPDTVEHLNTPKAFVPENLINRRIFGFHFFNSQNLSFEPSLNIPIPKDYVLGSGDIINISVWGAAQANYQQRIENNGAVNIPNIGTINVAGLNFDKAKGMILSRLYAIYGGMTGSSPNTWAEITLGALRSIKVSIIGEALTPGTYTLPATASAFNALYLSGGPNNNGSFREIKVMRDGAVIKKIDVYDYLINGNAGENIQLRDQDIILIPAFNIRVDVEGEFKRSGLFEMKENETLADLLRFSGGFSENAYKSNVTVHRNTSSEKEVKDVLFENFNKFYLKNGDKINAGILLERFANRVRIEGAVLRAGDYELSQGMNLKELIQKAGGLKENAFKNRALISRLKDDFTPENIAFDLDEILKGTNNILLKKEDIVTIRTIAEMEESKQISIYGEVKKPDFYPYADNMMLNDLIFLAGGFTDNADASVIEVSRRLDYKEAATYNNKLFNIFRFSISPDLKLSPKDASFVMKPHDVVHVRRAPNYRSQGNVQVSGEVNYAGTYSILYRNEKISDIIKRAGGVLEGSYPQGATLTRLYKLSDAEIKARQVLHLKDTTLKGLSDSIPETYIVGIELDKILQNPNSEYDLFIEPGDHINIPSVMQTVKVSGSVLNPIALVYKKGAGIGYYINQAGGYAANAYKSKTFVLFPNGTTSSSRGLISPTIKPGSEIRVPLKPEKKPNDNLIKWFSAMTSVASIGVSIATILMFAKKM